MKVKVTAKAKGELFVRSVGKTFPVNTKIYLTNEQFLDSVTQAAINGGLLEVIEGEGEEKVTLDGKLFINKYKNSLSFKCLKRTIPRGATFFVPTEYLEDMEIELAEGYEHIEEVKNNSAIEEIKQDVEPIKNEVTKKTSKKKTSKKKTSRKARKKTSKKKTGKNKKTSKIKKVSAESNESKEVSDTNLPEAEKIPVPEGMYAHDPHGEGVSFRKISKPKPTKSSKKDSDDILFIDGDKEESTIDFVDHEQTKERMSRLKSFPNNEEVF